MLLEKLSHIDVRGVCWSKLISDAFAFCRAQRAAVFSLMHSLLHNTRGFHSCTRIHQRMHSSAERAAQRAGGSREWAAGSISAPHTYYIHKTHTHQERGQNRLPPSVRERTAPAIWIESRDRCHLFTNSHVMNHGCGSLSATKVSMGYRPERQLRNILCICTSPSRSHLSSRGESDAVLRWWKAAPPRKIDRRSLIRLLPAAGDREHGLHQIQGPLFTSIPYHTKKQ